MPKSCNNGIVSWSSLANNHGKVQACLVEEEDYRPPSLARGTSKKTKPRMAAVSLSASTLNR